MSCLMKGEVNHVHEGHSGIVTSHRSEYELPAPDEDNQKEEYPSAEVKGIDFGFDVKKQLF